MSVLSEMYDLLERRRGRETVVLPAKERPGPKRDKYVPVKDRPGFKAGKPRKVGRRPRTDTLVLKMEANLSPLALRLHKHMKKTGAAYGVNALSDATGAPPKKVALALRELEAAEMVAQHKKSKGWYTEVVATLEALKEWKPTKTSKQGGFSIPSEYETMFGGEKAVMYKKGKKWFLDYKGKTHALPKKASFGHAEGIISRAK